MTRDEAAHVARALLATYGLQSAGLNAQGLGGLSLEAEDLALDHDAVSGVLKVSATVHRFRKVPLPRVLQALREEGARSAPKLGPGVLDYEPANQGLFVAVRYGVAPEVKALRAAVEALVPAARWAREELLPRVAARLSGF